MAGSIMGYVRISDDSLARPQGNEPLDPILGRKMFYFCLILQEFCRSLST